MMHRSLIFIFCALLTATPLGPYLYAQDYNGTISDNTETSGTPDAGNALSVMREQLRVQRAAERRQLDKINDQLSKNQLESLTNAQAAAPDQASLSPDATISTQPDTDIQTSASPEGGFSFIAPEPVSPGQTSNASQVNNQGQTSDTSFGGILSPE